MGHLLPAAAGNSDLEPVGQRERQAERREPPRRRSSLQQQARPPVGRQGIRLAVWCLRGACSRPPRRRQRHPEAAPLRQLQTSRPLRPPQARSPVGRPTRRVRRAVPRLRGDGGSTQSGRNRARRRIKEAVHTSESGRLGNESGICHGRRRPAATVIADAAAAAAAWAPAAVAAPHAAAARFLPPDVRPVQAGCPTPAAAVRHH